MGDIWREALGMKRIQGGRPGIGYLSESGSVSGYLRSLPAETYSLR